MEKRPQVSLIFGNYKKNIVSIGLTFLASTMILALTVKERQTFKVFPYTCIRNQI